MKASEFLMAKALEYDDFSLTKIAQELYESDADFEYIKEAGMIGSTLLSAGKNLLSNNVVKNTAIGMGTGAIAGAAAGGEGNRLSGALKGAALGGAAGGLVTGGMNVRNMMKSTPGLGLGKAIGAEAGIVGQSFKDFGSQVRPLLPKPKVP